MQFCRNCGKEVSETISFCPECGAKLKKESTSLVVWGYVCGGIALFFFPIGFGIAGVVIGIVNITKGRTGHGVAQIAIAVTLGILGAIWGAMVWSS